MNGFISYKIKPYFLNLEISPLLRTLIPEIKLSSNGIINSYITLNNLNKKH